MGAHPRHHRVRVALIACAALGLGGCRAWRAPAGFAPPDSTPDAYNGSVAALMWPGATRSFQVNAAGDLFNGAWFIRIVPDVRGVVAGPPQRIAYEDRWCPVVRWTRSSGAVRWDFEAVALPEPEPAPWSARGAVARMIAAGERRADLASEKSSLAGLPAERLTQSLLRVSRPLERSPVDRRNLFVSLLVTGTNLGTADVDARVALRCEPPGISPPYRAPDSLARTPWGIDGRSRGTRDAVVWLVEGEAQGHDSASYWHLRPGKPRTLRVGLAAYPVARAELEHVTAIPHARYVERTRAYWRHEVDRGAEFGVPDPELRSALRAARVVLLSLRERRDVDWVPLGGPFHYREVWIRDGARAAEALAVSGYTRESRQFARAFLRFQAPLGSFVSQGGQLDGTGQALWVFEQALLRPGPAAELGDFTDAAVAGWRALESQRNLTRAPRPGRASGLLPVTDPHDAELVHAQLVGNDAWALVGYRAAERMLRAAGRSGMADSVARSRGEYLAAFQRALTGTGREDIPPSWQGPGIDWGNLNVGYPCEVLEPGDAHLAALARRYWAPVGGPGLGYYRNPDSLHTYVAADLATWAMVVGDRAAADRILDATLRWRTASGCAAECFQGSTRDFGRNFPPHPTAAAALVSMVRNALVFDDADTLALCLGARASWWRGTTVRRAPTRWGRIDVRFVREGNTASWRWSAVPVWTLLALPPGTRPSTITAPLRPGPRPDLLLAPPRVTAAVVALVADSRR